MVKICNGECHTPSSSAAKEGDPARLFHTMQPKAKEALSINGEHSDTPYTSRPHVHLAAIDNSLSWPVYHPNSWRSYSYGWLYLPSSLIGHPFSKTVRDHFLPILTDPKWWSQTVFELRTLFSQDADFSERMFKKQIAVFKGQAYNVVQSLRNLDEGPLELCRRKTCIVHDDEVAMADDSFTREMIEAAAAPLAGIILQGSGSGETSAPIDVQMYSAPGRDMSASLDALVRPIRSSSGNDTTAERPHYNRTSTYISQRSRPIPVSQRVDLNRTTFGGASGFALMEHMERVEKRERDAYPGMDPNPPGDDEEEHQDVWTEYPRRQHSSRREAASLDFSRRPSDTPEGGQHPDKSRMPRRNTLDISISERASVIHPKMKTVIVEVGRRVRLMY
jgi:phosphatidylinositol 4-kinase type 2